LTIVHTIHLHVSTIAAATTLQQQTRMACKKTFTETHELQQQLVATATYGSNRQFTCNLLKTVLKLDPKTTLIHMTLTVKELF